ncbi:MAG: GxxExxY protein [Holophaga sp.]|nr:GxxExxY protein [Holophaga sp.]
MAIQDPLTGLIFGSCFRVATEPGPGFLEKVYENALAHELRKAKAKVVQQQGIEAFYDGVNVGNYEADLLVENRVLVEWKAVQALDSAHVAQCVNDMKGTGLVTCLLVNSGRAKLQVRRLSMDRGTEAGDVELKVDEVQ